MKCDFPLIETDLRSSSIKNNIPTSSTRRKILELSEIFAQEQRLSCCIDTTGSINL
jgi:hypothetical protein